MIAILLPLVILSSTISCSSQAPETDYDVVQYVSTESDENILNRAESEASEGGRRILETSRSMIITQDVVVGGCWDFMNTVYKRAGFNDKKRETVFKSKYAGPYLEEDIIQAGDWLYFVNHSYNDIEHSAIFVAWTNKEKKEALMVNYVGENKKKPAFYKKFILDNVYNVIRPIP